MLLNEIINEVGMTKRAGQEFFVFLLKMGNPNFRRCVSKESCEKQIPEA